MTYPFSHSANVATVFFVVDVADCHAMAAAGYALGMEDASIFHGVCVILGDGRRLAFQATMLGTTKTAEGFAFGGLAAAA